ncbi:MAG TPA: S8 family serine peptidase, partial [Chitinophagales bacterium]|nr:S8 family serine peptidase [Chitinophagales bacterium]
MIKTLATLILFLSACLNFTQAQTSTKLDLETFMRLRKGDVKPGHQHLLVKGDLVRIKQLAKLYGGYYKYGYNNIASVEIPDARLMAFSQEAAVEQIENPNTRGHLLMDTARIRNNIDPVHNGVSPLVNGLKGRGVIVGIIDGGIYWAHEDFRDAQGNTRIRYIWDETFVNGTVKPQPYNYGNEWNWQDINNGNCTHIEPAGDASHGTCVAGVAAGNGLSLLGDSLSGDSMPEKRYVGVAPESEIIFVRVDINAPNFSARMADAVDYIFKKADAMGRPCVINTSLGLYSGAHDGKDLATQMMEALLEERNGRALVAAAGNAGNVDFHVGYNLSPDSAYTMFAYNYAKTGVYFDFWADTTSFKNAQFAIGCNDENGTNLGRTSYYNVVDSFNPAPNSSIQITRPVGDFNQLYGNVTIQVGLSEGRYHVEVYVNAAPPLSNLWRLQTRGSGKLDLWSHPTLTGTSQIVKQLNGVDILFQNYRHADRIKTTTGAWQCSDKVITVGNYSSRGNYLDVDSQVVDLVNAFPVGEVVGERYVTSSTGPTRDNRLKPDLVATGHTIIATGNLTDIDYRLNNGERFVVGYGGKHRRIGGTSVASA